MNFSSELIKILEWIAEKFGIVIDWASTDLIPKLTEILMRFAQYKTLANLIGAGTFMLFSIIFGTISAISAKRRGDEITQWFFGFCAIACLGGVIGLGIVALEWHIVPEIRLIEYIQNQLANID